MNKTSHRDHPARRVVATEGGSHVLECGHTLPRKGDLPRRRCYKCYHQLPKDTAPTKDNP